MGNGAEYRNIVNSLGYKTHYHYLEEALSRNIGFFTLAEQDRLMHSTVAIPGLGGVGGQYLVTLARTGVGSFHLSDFDVFEPANLNRQYGARVRDFGRAKIDAMVEEALNINPFLKIKRFGAVDEENIDDFLDGVDVVADGMDFFNFDVRRLIFNSARDRGIHVVTAGPLGFSSALLVFAPDRGMTFDAYFNISDSMSLDDKLLSFFVGLAPRAAQMAYLIPGSIDMEHHKGPSTGAGCQMCAASAIPEMVRILLGKKGVKPAPHYFQYDPYARKFHQGRMPFGNKNPVQRLKFALTKRMLKKSKEAVKPDVMTPPLDLFDGKTIPDELMNYLLWAGIQAPSGDNCQPWKFKRPSNSRVEVYLDPGADHSLFNVDQIASLISCGAAVENISLAATRYGLSSEIRYFPNEQEENHVASIELTYDAVRENPLGRFIRERRTNRTKYDGEKIPREHMELLKNCRENPDTIPGVDLRLIHKREEMDTIAKIVFSADRIRVENRRLHEHFASMLRFSGKEALEKRDGLPLENLEAGLGGEMFLRMTKRWGIMNMMNGVGVSRLVPLAAYKGIKEASCVGFITGEDMSRESFVRGGRFLERIWLTATRLGLSFQPMTPVTLFWQRWRLGKIDVFEKKHIELLENLWESYRPFFDVGKDDGRSHVMLFRLGYGKHPSCRTLRKNISEFWRP